MDNLKAVINKAASAFLYRAAWGVAKEVSKQAPKVTGNLAQNIKAQMHGAFNATVGNTAEIYYAKYVYFGTRPHVIRPKKKKALGASYDYPQGKETARVWMPAEAVQISR